MACDKTCARLQHRAGSSVRGSWRAMQSVNYVTEIWRYFFSRAVCQSLWMRHTDSHQAVTGRAAGISRERSLPKQANVP